MFELILLLGVGLFLVGLFAFWAFAQWGVAVELPPSEVAHIAGFVPLRGASYRRAERLFDARDYRFLAAQPALKEATRRLERDRRRIALEWLRLVREDYGHLLRFRRVLLACGAPTDAQTEWRLLRERLAFVFVHAVLTQWIRLFGLYAAPRAHTALLASLRQVSTLLAVLLGRLSPSQLADLKEIWAAQQSSLSLAD